MIRYSRKAMHEILATLLDYIFPPHEEALCVRRLTETSVSRLYTPFTVGDIRALSRYESKYIRALVHEAKFHGNKRAFILLHTLFTTFLGTYTKPIDILIPIPLSTKRMRERGYNQVTEILTSSESRVFEKINGTVLRRVRNTQPQTELGRQERLRNMTEAFVVMSPERISGKHILLVDDVTTTGATFSAAKAALLPYSPASVTCVALAH